MKWINHRIVTGVAMYAVTDSLLLTGIGVLGSTFPDKIEGNPWQTRRFWRWNLAHRGWSHAPLIYLIMIGAMYFAVSQTVIVSMTDIFLRDMAVAFFLGALLHIMEDAFCGKVPLVTPSYKVGLSLFKVGSFAEYLFAAVCVVVILAAKYYVNIGL